MRSRIWLALLIAASGMASAEEYRWDGFYLGLNGGVLWNSTCSNWSPQNPTLAANFDSGKCPNNSNFLGGGQLGYNWQVDNIVFGLEGDYDGVSSSTKSRSRNYPGTVGGLPAGTYNFSEKSNPNGLGTIRFRLGYAIDAWLPYITAGAALAGGSGNATATFTPVGGSEPTATFLGGKSFSSNGWTVGLGTEYQLASAWSVKLEYLYVNLGKGSDQVSGCQGTPAACSAFANESFLSHSNSATGNIVRLGFNYRFGSPSPRAAEVVVPVAAAAPAYVAPPPAPAPPLCPNTPPGVKVDKYGCACDITQEVHFATDSDVLTDQDKAILDKMIPNLQRLNFVNGEIDGYTDATGRAAYNQGLSERRAQAVADYLQSHGISGGRMTVKGFGEDNPVADNSTAEGRAHNRRVVLHRTNCDQ